MLENMIYIEFWFISGIQIILKCLNNLGVTLFLPPPGGAHADIKLVSLTYLKNNFFKS